ncbi:mannosylglycerate hydrolase [Seinonella peptonophila]|uniref:Mannosylglycerate hydrolase n=1 Tax=Seinonella peptonophila TaxID=112248 RepID=A0A1M4ZTW2_9BACL|nr:glycoside hydrolase family 38 C-terminal domain-containing protein [Seinonella peptonophila]SHF21046.1 mannosylglycerate hydrolase [Seinonella peptonophila]
MKKIANSIHHTHWDPIWYFTAQDAFVQFSYNMKELLSAFDEGLVKDFFLDGQTAAIDEYLETHPEDRERVKKLIEEKKLFIGPFHSQLDCFISSGESVVNNLRLGISSANKLGGVSKIAYLPDSFGHSYDFPKIFNQMGIYDFVITRGVGDEYDLGSEFYMTSNDGSSLLVCTMLSGYGYGTYAFKAGTLFSEEAVDYNKIDVKSLIDRLIEKSTVPKEFVFPLGFDQNPAILNIEEQIEKYNSVSEEIEFRLTTWEEYMKKVREKGVNIKTHQSELFSTQYHRVHKSIFSARSDIKSLQDKAERILTFEVQPLMSMLDSLGIEYDKSIIDKAWETLVRCQTHSSATLTDETNEYIKVESNNAVNIATATKVYLMKVVSISIPTKDSRIMPLVVYNTLPYVRDVNIKLNIFTKNEDFKLVLNEKELDYTVVDCQKIYGGVLRKDPSLLLDEEYFYKTTVIVQLKNFKGISYQTIYVHDYEIASKQKVKPAQNIIENTRYKIVLNETGIQITDKKLGKTFDKAIYIDESGDEGDNYDYSYPDPEDDMVIHHFFETGSCSAYNADGICEMTIEGQFDVPSDLESRRKKKLNSLLKYTLNIRLKEDSDVIELSGSFKNAAKNHRVRIVYSTDFSNTYSYAGTQYGYIKRATEPEELKVWKQENWFEEPSPTNPLLNHVSAVGNEYVLSAFTRSVKEYEFIGEGKKDVALTIFRSVGHLGLPDLNRRPGRPSGLDYMVFDTPESQLLGEIKFEIGVSFYSEFDANVVMNDYIKYATDVIYYQNQQFEKAVFPLAYFPTNPLRFPVPDTYHFFSLDESDASFGTVVKSADNSGYVVRIYNNENQAVAAGNLNLDIDYENIYNTNLLESEVEETSSELGVLKPGELRNIKIIKS